MKEFSSRTVLVTGAGKGIGRAICHRLAADGAAIIAVARTEDDLAQLRDEIGATILAADLAVRSEREEVAHRALPADLLVNCAGTNILEPFLDMQVESYESIMAINLTAPLFLSQAYARERVKAGRPGAIVNLSSLSAQKGFHAHAAYCASKAGLDGATRVMANELGPHGIRVNSVNPGVTLTELAAVAWSAPEKAGPMLSRTPLGRFASPDDVAQLVAFLLSDRASMITGTTNLLDGGFSAA